MNLASDISSFVNSIFEDALFVARDNNLMQPLVTTFSDAQGLASRKLQAYGTATIRPISESDDLVSQTYAPSALTTLTPAEFGAQIVLTDLRMESDPFEARDDAARELGVAMAQSIENNLVSTFTSLTGGTIGTAGSALTWGHFTAAMTTLRMQNAPLPYYSVLSPAQYHSLAKSASIAGATSAVGQPTWGPVVAAKGYCCPRSASAARATPPGGPGGGRSLGWTGGELPASEPTARLHDAAGGARAAYRRQ
jgi:hypothetical protein